MASEESLVSAVGRESDANAQQHASIHHKPRDVGAGLSAGSLATIVVFGTIVLVGSVAFAGLYIARRRRAKREKSSHSSTHQKEQSYEHSYHDVEDSLTTRRNRLQKKNKKKFEKAWPLSFEEATSTPTEEEIMSSSSPIRHTALPQIPPLFTTKSGGSNISFSSFFGKLSPTKSTKTAKSWKQTSWIDEDILHGPKMSDVRDVNGQPFSRDSWPLYTLTAPTMPTVTTEHVHPYYRGLYQQHQMAQAQITQQPQVHMVVGAQQPYITSAGPRQLPLPPPRPALVTSNWVTSTMGHAGGYYSIQDLVGNGGRSLTNISLEPPRQQQPPVQQHQQQTTIQTSGRSRSRSRSHHRRPSRQSSTDSTLSEILKSTEQRLAERSPSKTRPGMTSNNSGTTSSRETLLARGDRSTDDTGPCQVCRSCSASPTKRSPDQMPPLTNNNNNNSSSAMGHNRGGSDSSALGHRRNNSDSSAISEPDSLLENDFQVMPAGLTSPSRTARSQDTPDQSPAASVSSGLPTLYSESEAEEEEEDETNERSPLRPTIYQRAMMRQSIQPPQIPDPFTSPSTSPTRPTTSHGIPSQASLRKTTFGAGLLGKSSPKDTAGSVTSPNMALQMRYTNQLHGAAAAKAASSSPQQPHEPGAAAGHTNLPLDLYKLCTPPRQDAPLKSPTIISPNPDSLPSSVHPKKRTFFGSTSTINSTPTSSPPPPVPALPLPASANSSPTSSPTSQQQPFQPAAIQPRPKAYPPPHNLKPKGSSPTLGHYSPLTSPSTYTFPFAPSSTSSTPSSQTAATPKGPRPRPGDEPCAPPPSLPPPQPPFPSTSTTPTTKSITKRHQPFPIKTPIAVKFNPATANKYRFPSGTSNSSSVYSQESSFAVVPPLPSPTTTTTTTTTTSSSSQQQQQQTTGGGGQVAVALPVVSTVAALRRMNSAVSHASSAASDGSTNTVTLLLSGNNNNTPPMPSLTGVRGSSGRFAGLPVSVSGSISSASTSTSKGTTGSITAGGGGVVAGGVGGGGVGVGRRGRHARRGTNGSRNYLGLLEVGKRGSRLDRVEVADVVVWDDKENRKEGEEGGDGKDGRDGRDGDGEGDEMGEKRGEGGGRTKKEWRDSKDSLGLYDEDGFLISSPVRGGDQ